MIGSAHLLEEVLVPAPSTPYPSFLRLGQISADPALLGLQEMAEMATAG